MDFKLVIQDDEGKTTIVSLTRDEITIGRKEGNTIRLTERNVSRRHARILRNNGEVHIEDLGSYNGIRVNNARIAERVSLRVSDQVQIGDYKLYLKTEAPKQPDDVRTTQLEHVSSQIPTEVMSAPPIALSPHPIHQALPALPALPAPLAPPAPQTNGNPNRQSAGIADTDPAGRPLGPMASGSAFPGRHGRLVVLSSNFAGKEFELSRAQMIIGRTDENDLVINHRSISRNHAKLVRDPETGRYTISDLQSSNGVRVNGQDYGKVELRRGDVVDLGHVRLRFVEASEDFVFARDAVITDVPEAGSGRGMMVAFLAAVVVVVAGIAVYAMRSTPKDKDAVAVVTRAGSNGDLLMDAGDVSDAAATNMAVRPDAGKTQQLARCTALATRREWQALDDCATELEALGIKDKVAELHAKAKRETANEIDGKKLQQALRDRDLKAAEVLLEKIGAASVYYASLREAFLKSEAPAVEEAKRKAQGYAAAHDCAGLRQYKLQIAASTQKVASAVQAIRCTEKSQSPGSSVAIKPPVGPGNGSAPSGKPGCDASNVENLMTQAANQYSNGFAGSAFALLVKALNCKQDIRMYRLAAMYACGARDLANAKIYFNKVPPNLQSGIEQKCQQERLDVRGP